MEMTGDPSTMRMAPAGQVKGAPKQPFRVIAANVLDPLNWILEVLLTACGALGVLAWWTGRGEDPHGYVFIFLAAVTIFPMGVAMLIAAYAGRRQWRLWIYAQLCAFVWPYALHWYLF